MRQKADRRARRATVLAACCSLVAGLQFGAGPADAAYQPGIPAAVDPGTPTFGGAADPVPAEPAALDPSRSVLQAIYDADLAAGGTSFWFDRILARPFSAAAGETSLLTRGRALFMYTHSPGALGFASGGTGNGQGGQGNGWAYRQPLAPTTPATVRDLYTVAVSGGPLTEETAQRVQYPSHYSARFSRAGLTVAERKFITDNNVAVTDLTLTNTGAEPASVTLTANSPIATTPAAGGTELSGSVTLRYAVTTIFPRFSGDGFAVAGTGLTRDVTLAPGASTTVKVQLGAIAAELPGSAADYRRYRGYDPTTAWLTQLREYNRFWVDNVPYVDIPDKNVEKISYYRAWENRFNSFDGNIPGNDYQFPVDLEGAFGYNNQISLTVPMRMQDLKYYRDPLSSYGPWLSQGEESGCQAFHDNPGNTGNWNNTYEQWTAAEAWQSYLVHGGPPAVVRNLAKYAECDAKGTLTKFDTNRNDLIEYSAGTLPGNDADSVAFGYYGTRPQDRTETSYWYAGAKAAAEEYTLLGDTAKATEMNAIAERVKTAVLGLWAPGQVTNRPEGPGVVCAATGGRVAGRLGSAVKLCGQNEYVSLPTGLLSGLSDFTVSAWVNPGANTAWSRVFDFGTGTTANMFLTVSAGGGPLRFAITTGGGGAEQQINGTGTLPLNTFSHVTVTLAGNTGTLYVNGVAVGTNTGITLRPASLGNTGNNWIGRSQYGDPFLNATVDDVDIYDHALTGAEVAALAGGQPGAGNVASYRFDEIAGAAAADSSGNGRDATVVSNPPPAKPTITCPGKVFLQRDLTTGSQVCWKDQQNFAPFIDGIPPNTDDYKQALRYYADRAEFGIMPSYTADQADKAAEIACGLSCSPAAAGQSNNFSNINATLQARLYSKALRDYPSQYITPDMYRKLIEWLSWNEYVDGDNRFPDNNEFFFGWNPDTRTLGRSFIHHDVLGSFNWMFFEDVAGVRARLDDTLELWPIDMGLDHFMINNLSYHGSNLTVLWQQPGGRRYYPLAPVGYSVYLDGQRAFTVADLAHVSWNSSTGAVGVLDGSGTNVLFSTARPLQRAAEVGLSGNARLTDGFATAGVDLSGASGSTINLARDATAAASFTTTTPAAQATSPANAVDGFTVSAPPVVSGSFVGTNPIWGTQGSPNPQDWLQLDLAAPTRLNTVRLYFYSNKAFGVGGNTYREPADYTVQYLTASGWVDVPGQVKSPATPMPNYNQVDFPPLVTRQLRVLLTRAGSFGVGVKEIQLFDLEPVLGQLGSITAYVAGLPVGGGVKNSLTVKLTRAAARYRSGRTGAAVDLMSAFTSQVNSLTGGGVLTAEQAAVLVASATAVRTHMLE
jgi:hypothetical protein